MTRLATLAIWTVAILCPLLAGAIAATTIFMAVSLDPGQAITAGLDPWVDALPAVAWCAGLIVACVVGLRFWHSRLWPVGLALVAAVLLSTLRLFARFVGEYF